MTAFKIATPYSLYVCPEGQNVTLTCRLLGPLAKGHDVTFYKTWYRSSRGEVQVCSERRPIRNLTFQDLHLHHSGHQANTSQDLAQRYGLESASDHHGNFTITMRNLTLLDGGLYCCLVVELRHHHSEQRLFGAMELQVQRGEPPALWGGRGRLSLWGWCLSLSGRMSRGRSGWWGCVCLVCLCGVTLCWGVSDSVWVALALQGWYGMWSCEHLFLGHWVWWRGRAYWALLMTVGFF